jgi:hypothetical protein
MKSPKSERGFAHLAVVVVLVLALIVGVGLYVYKSSKNTTPVLTNIKITHPGLVKSEVFATSLDAMGAPVNPIGTFATTIPKIYVGLALNNAKATQKIEYTRYLNGEFVDNGSTSVKDGAKYASFVFSLKSNKTHPKGTYVVKTYTNGVFERSATYKVQ